MKEWWTAEELGAFSASSLPTSKRGINKLAAREGWTTATSPSGEPLARKRQGKGGGWEYHVSLLPLAARADLRFIKFWRPSAGDRR